MDGQAGANACGWAPVNIDTQVATKCINLLARDLPNEGVDPLDATEHALEDAMLLTEAMVATAALAVEPDGWDEEAGFGFAIAFLAGSW